MRSEDDGLQPGRAKAGLGREAGEGRTAVLVTGMHRNGTSALARTLSLLGAALPRDLVPPNDGNPRGHWEPQGMVDLNDRMLADAGSDLYSVRDFAPGWFGSAAASAFTDEAARLIAASFADERLVVLKDPRTALLAPVWNEALARQGFRVVHVLPLRHPADVAESLRRRHLKTISYDAWAKPRGEAVWLRYTLAALRGSRGHSRAFLRYGDLVADWRREVARVGAELGIRWPGLGTGAQAEVDAFLHGNDRADGRHPPVIVGGGDLGRLDLAGLAAACHDALATSAGDPARIDAAEAAFGAAFDGRIAGGGDLIAAFEDLYALVWRFYEEGGALRQSLDLAAAAEARLREASQRSWAALTVANNDKLRLQLDAGSRDRQLASLAAELARSNDLAGGAAARAAELEAQNALLAEALAGIEGAMDARLSEHLVAADAARRGHGEAEARLAALHGSTSWRLTAPLRALSRAVRGRA
ncbi:hypothetical protein [Lichenibacterium dinghuense]|uniref:hypothetical protein n=1 Tax=Lichenibacterium dinghuense TaxID=2895977 RepID=UPI001F20A26D|nr:hypothetical protein [Lichenibacterium sp. 6Y81]